MVDVSAKSVTKREAEASAFVVLKAKVLNALPKIPRAIRWRWRGWQELWPPSERPI